MKKKSQNKWRKQDLQKEIKKNYQEAESDL
jgi:hypothetical protein